MTSTNELSTTVAIVGGGPVGTALAITLAQQGIESTIVERHPGIQHVPKGQNLTQRTMEHFRRWGIESELRSARTMSASRPIAGQTAYGSLLGDYRYGWLQRELVRPFYAAANERLPQYATERVLRERRAELPESTALYGWAAHLLDQSDEGIRLRIRSNDGEESTLLADYAVGCDGARSIVRAQAGIGQEITEHDRLMVLVVFRSAAFDRVMLRYPDIAFANVLRPDLEGYWQFFGRVDDSETWFFHAPAPEGTDAASVDVAGLLARAVGVDFAFDIEYLGFWDLRFALADSYRSGRVFVAGDAAHSHPPYGGYGINSGFEDAVNIGWKLAADVHGWAGPGLLDSYDRERRLVFASTRDDFIARSIADDRDFLAEHDPERDRSGFERAWLAREAAARSEVAAFEPNYEGSSVSVGETSARPSALGGHRVTARAGHHLAPHLTRDGGEIFASLGAGFSILTPDRQSIASFITTARALGIPLTCVEISDDAARAYGSPHVLVRPDQFVSWAGDTSAVAADSVLSRSVGRLPGRWVETPITVSRQGPQSGDE